MIRSGSMARMASTSGSNMEPTLGTLSSPYCASVPEKRPLDTAATGTSSACRMSSKARSSTTVFCGLDGTSVCPLAWVMLTVVDCATTAVAAHIRVATAAVFSCCIKGWNTRFLFNFCSVFVPAPCQRNEAANLPLNEFDYHSVAQFNVIEQPVTGRYA